MLESRCGPQNHFLFPTSAPRQQPLTAGITIHYVSVGKGLQRAGEKLSPYFTIETCQWNNHRHWQVARELFFIYLFLFSSLVWNRQMLRTHWSWFQDTCTALLVPYAKSRSRPPSAFPGFIQGLSSYCLIHHCHGLQGKNHTDLFSIQQNTEAVLNPERAHPHDR